MENKRHCSHRVICREEATGNCPRCNAPTCDHHRYAYIDGNNKAITKNSPFLCLKCQFGKNEFPENMFDRFDRVVWINEALRLVPKQHHSIVSAQFHVLMDRIEEEYAKRMTGICDKHMEAEASGLCRCEETRRGRCWRCKSQLSDGERKQGRTCCDCKEQLTFAGA